MLYRAVTPLKGVNRQVSPGVWDPSQLASVGGATFKNGRLQSLPSPQVVINGGAGGTVVAIMPYVQIDGTKYLIIATATKLYRYKYSDSTIADISGGFTFSPDYKNPWTWQVWLNVIYMSNLRDGVYQWNGTGNVTVLTNAPQAKAIGVLNDHLCLLNVTNYNGDGLAHPQRFAWCNEGDPTTWLAAVTNDAGYVDLTGTPTPGVAISTVVGGLAAYKEDALTPVSFIGGNEVFAFDLPITETGIDGPLAVAIARDNNIALFRSGVYGYAGSRSVDYSRGDPIRRIPWLANPAGQNLGRVLYWEDRAEIWVLVNTLGGTTQFDTAYIQDFISGQWSGPHPFVGSSAVIAPAQLGNGRTSLFVGTTAGGNILVNEYGADYLYLPAGAQPAVDINTEVFSLAGLAEQEDGRPVIVASDEQLTVTGLSVDFMSHQLPPTGTWGISVSGYDDLANAPKIVTGSTVLPEKLDTGANRVRLTDRVTGRFFQVQLRFVPTKLVQDLHVMGFHLEFEKAGRR